jgi:hypothetical protein
MQVKFLRVEFEGLCQTFFCVVTETSLTLLPKLNSPAEALLLHLEIDLMVRVRC